MNSSALLFAFVKINAEQYNLFSFNTKTKVDLFNYIYDDEFIVTFFFEHFWFNIHYNTIEVNNSKSLMLRYLDFIANQLNAHSNIRSELRRLINSCLESDDKESKIRLWSLIFLLSWLVFSNSNLKEIVKVKSDSIYNGITNYSIFERISKRVDLTIQSFYAIQRVIDEIYQDEFTPFELIESHLKGGSIINEEPLIRDKYIIHNVKDKVVAPYENENSRISVKSSNSKDYINENKSDSIDEITPKIYCYGSNKNRVLYKNIVESPMSNKSHEELVDQLEVQCIKNSHRPQINRISSGSLSNELSHKKTEHYMPKCMECENLQNQVASQDLEIQSLKLINKSLSEEIEQMRLKVNKGNTTLNNNEALIAQINILEDSIKKEKHKNEILTDKISDLNNQIAKLNNLKEHFTIVKKELKAYKCKMQGNLCTNGFNLEYISPLKEIENIRHNFANTNTKNQRLLKKVNITMISYKSTHSKSVKSNFSADKSYNASFSFEEDNQVQLKETEHQNLLHKNLQYRSKIADYILSNKNKDLQIQELKYTNKSLRTSKSLNQLQEKDSLYKAQHLLLKLVKKYKYRFQISASFNLLFVLFCLLYIILG